MSKTTEEDLKAKIVELEKWIELYQAQADGKTVQWENRPLKLWQIHTGSFTHPVEFYRIKPDEPEFKVGDWVVHKQHGRPVQFNKECSPEFYKPWQPQEGDVVVYNETTNNMLTICRVTKDMLNHGLTKDTCVPYVGQPFEDMK